MSEPRGSGIGAHAWIRSNILGLVAIFIALGGSAVATQVATKQGATTAKKKRGPPGPPGPAGAPGPVGPQGAAGLLTGPAGGDLTGNFPNPQIASQAVGPGETGVVPAAKAVTNTLVSVPNNTQTTLPFDGTQFDYANLHSNTINPQRLTAPIAGVYLVEAEVVWAVSDSGVGVREITLGGPIGGGADVRKEADATINTVNNLSTIVELLPGDDVTVVATQTSGAALNAGGQLSMIWLGPLAPA
jgi:hypothetical protein